VVLARVGRIWGVFKPGQTTSFDSSWEARGRVASWIGLFSYSLLVGFAVGGLVVPRRPAPVSYPWQTNQVDITGATLSNYTVNAAPLADTGAKYRCHVTNMTGEIYSSAATLTVNPAPQAPVITSFTANPTPITLGQSTTLAWAVTGATNLYFLETGLGNVTGLTSKQVTPANSGTYSYTLAAENAAGITYASVEVKVNPIPTFPLTVNLGTGVTGAPSVSNTYAQGTVVSYSYSLVAGYSNLQVTLDGNPTAASGSVTMDAAHTLTVTSGISQTPIITSIAPSEDIPGASVIISGTNFDWITLVKFNGIQATYTKQSNTQITAIVPSLASSGTISVISPSGTGLSPVYFSTGTPAITNFNPTSAPIGSKIIITGRYLSHTNKVSFHGYLASFTIDNDNQISAIVPTGATTGPIHIDAVTPGFSYSANSASNFSVIIPPYISGFSPTQGAVGTTVSIYGTSLTGVISVWFNGAAASF